jgi:uncharacterized protein YijF (DUF1287 family)
MLRSVFALLVLGPVLRAGDSAMALVQSAKRQIGVTLHYDGSYRKLAYPGGDVPMDRGVCTDVLIRAYRNLGIDLQPRVHEDMVRNWSGYPNSWGAKGPDRNIDHRRVPNLACFFSRFGETLAVTHEAGSYLPGEIVIWMLPSGLPHIGIVGDAKGPSGAPLVIHNIGQGTRMEDILFAYRITGHVRYFPASQSPRAL